ncbi:MAG: CDP-diacylglycerol--serine O-phosphatidyltransferase, partial [Azoarcus sp.]|nr:CDP-diacylglycerol--serine O-phosphatidyltransferase [Azoarcus sp.]
MKNAQTQRYAPRSLPAVWRSWREKMRDWKVLDNLSAIPVMAENFETLENPEAYRRTLLSLIAQARQRILLATLYLQDDDGGREVLEALHAAKAARPELEVAVFVDWHRAQRGLIGKDRSLGNVAMYRAMAERFGPGVEIHGVPVQRSELMGVMHLKGFIVDDAVLYSGASLNDVYLQRHGRYRLDRYHLIRSRALADCLAVALRTLRQSPAVHPLHAPSAPKTAKIRPEIIAFRRELAHTRYRFVSDRVRQGEIGITPLFGLGSRDNELNQTIVELIHRAKTRLVLFTPYFN